ncbi:MAG: TOBE domain-containing protein [Cyanobacteria bacterium Co-bin13]|nr:TOBE domain-containing protein [Cyanobacteria bacterium Co-bin13]
MPRKNQGWITFQASEEERQILEQYCDRSQRTKTDILRELVRSLEQPSPALANAETDTPELPEANLPEGVPGLAISARNLLRAKIKQIVLSGVSAEVTLAVGSNAELTSVITRTSAERLGLTVGKDVYAVIKSNNVMIAAITP